MKLADIPNASVVTLYETISDKKLFFVFERLIISPSEGTPVMIDLNSCNQRHDHANLINRIFNGDAKILPYTNLYHSELGAQSMFRMLLGEAIERANIMSRNRTQNINHWSEGFLQSMNKMFANSPNFAGLSEQEIKEKIRNARYNDSNFQPQSMLAMLSTAKPEQSIKNSLRVRVDLGFEGLMQHGQEEVTFYVEPTEKMMEFLRIFSYFQYDVSKVYVNFSMRGEKMHADMKYVTDLNVVSMTAVTPAIKEFINNHIEDFLPARQPEVSQEPMRRSM